MNPETLQVLRELADKLGTTAEHLWAVLVRQAYYQGWYSLAEVVMFAMFAVVAGYRSQRAYRWVHDEDGDEIGWLPVVTFGLAAAIMLGCMMCSIQQAITCFGNPEYYALHEILSAGAKK